MQRRRRKQRRAPLASLLPTLLALAAVTAWLALRHPRAAEPPAPHRLTMAEARALNAAVPFADTLAPARPFRFRGTPAGREQAVQCLATAALYEAGADTRGQKAVIQVVLNRLRSGHYPATVCGVVYQGAERPTGCQFSFTFDHSELRRPEHRGWTAARRAARRALAGYVFRPVGTATHYHADWVVPYWQNSLDKVAQVEHHIFYQPPQG